MWFVTVCVSAGNAGLRGPIGNDGSSSDPAVKWWGWLLIALAILSVLGLLLAALYMYHRLRHRKLQKPAADATPPLDKKVLLPLAHTSRNVASRQQLACCSLVGLAPNEQRLAYN